LALSWTGPFSKEFNFASLLSQAPFLGQHSASPLPGFSARNFLFSDLPTPPPPSQDLFSRKIVFLTYPFRWLDTSPFFPFPSVIDLTYYMSHPSLIAFFEILPSLSPDEPSPPGSSSISNGLKFRGVCIPFLSPPPPNASFPLLSLCVGEPNTLRACCSFPQLLSVPSFPRRCSSDVSGVRDIASGVVTLFGSQ